MNLSAFSKSWRWQKYHPSTRWYPLIFKYKISSFDTLISAYLQIQNIILRHADIRLSSNTK